MAHLCWTQKAPFQGITPQEHLKTVILNLMVPPWVGHKKKIIEFSKWKDQRLVGFLYVLLYLMFMKVCLQGWLSDCPVMFICI